MSYDPDRPRREAPGDGGFDALFGPAAAGASPADPTGADHLAESARRAVPSPAAPLDIDRRLLAAVVAVAVLVLLVAVLRWRHRS
jgi:hypothetical protein